jgi:hypothetical protein
MNLLTLFEEIIPVYTENNRVKEPRMFSIVLTKAAHTVLTVRLPRHLFALGLQNKILYRICNCRLPYVACPVHIKTFITILDERVAINDEPFIT